MRIAQSPKILPVFLTMATNVTFHPGSVESSERIDLLKQKGVTIWLTGLSASGKASDQIDIARAIRSAHECFSRQSLVRWSSTCCTWASFRTDSMAITSGLG